MSTVAVTSGLGALPSRFRRERLLIVGYGDVGQRMARNLLTGPGAQRLAGFIKNTQVHDAVLKAMGFRR